MTDFRAGDIVKLKKTVSDRYVGLDIDRYHYIVLARNNRISYDMLGVNTLRKHFDVNLDEYELT